MKIVAVVDPDTALGFRLAGVEVREVSSAGEAASVLGSLLKSENALGREAGLVLYGEDYSGALSEELRSRMERSDMPIFTPVPSLRTWQEKERARDYVAGLLKRTIGYQIRLR